MQPSPQLVSPAQKKPAPAMAPPEPERPFQLTTLLRLGKRYIFRSPWLAILYIVFTLLSSTVIPIAVAANYGKLTNFFAASSATRASQNAAPSSSKTNSADASQHPATAPREPTPGAMTTTYLIWLGLTLALLGLSFAVRISRPSSTSALLPHCGGTCLTKSCNSPLGSFINIPLVVC
jgi:hypothetical protein